MRSYRSSQPRQSAAPQGGAIESSPTKIWEQAVGHGFFMIGHLLARDLAGKDELHGGTSMLAGVVTSPFS
jgi:hypothetical protein